MAVSTITQAEPAKTTQSPKQAQVKPTPLVEVIHVKKFYGPVRALDDITFSLNPGEFVSLVGPSGAGKSTLTRLLIREEKVTSGEIRVAGRNIATLGFGDVPYYRRKLGVVFQDFKLLPQKTVRENVAFALEICDIDESEVRQRVPSVLELVGLAKLQHRYPRELSGGEQQRTSIARALVHNPKILIADEPTGNLDPRSSIEVIEVLQRINRTGTLVILASHNKAIVDRLGARVILLRDGKLVSDQPHGRYVL